MNRKSDTAKNISVFILFVTSLAITFSGMFFIVFSYVNDIRFHILNVSLPGFVFGLLVSYLGVRYFMMVMKLKNEVGDPSAQFSWNNFRRKTSAKNR